MRQASSRGVADLPYPTFLHRQFGLPQGAVDRTQHRLQRGSDDIAVHPDAEAVFRGAVVVGVDHIAHDWLGAPAGSLLSEEAVKAMALGVCRVLGTEVGLAATAVTDPQEQAGYRLGTAFLGLAISGQAEFQPVRLPGRTEQIRQFSVISLLNFLRLRLLV